MKAKWLLVKQILILAPDPHLALHLQDYIEETDPLIYPYLFHSARDGREVTRKAGLAEPDLLVAYLSTLQSLDPLLITFLLGSVAKGTPLVIVPEFYDERPKRGSTDRKTGMNAIDRPSAASLLPQQFQHLLHQPGVAVLDEPVSISSLLDTIKSFMHANAGTPDSASPSTILICDDDPDILKVAVMKLKRLGFTILQATNGALALELARTAHPDLILSDNEMPILNGLELLHAIRQEQPDLPFILMTGNGAEEIAATALKLGAKRYLIKPLQFTEVEHALREVLEQQRLQRMQQEATERLRQMSRELLTGAAEQQHNLTMLQILDEVSQQISSNLAVEEVFHRITEALVTSFQATFAGIWLTVDMSQALSSDTAKAYYTAGGQPAELFQDQSLLLRSWAGITPHHDRLVSISDREANPLTTIALTKQTLLYTRDTKTNGVVHTLPSSSLAGGWLDGIGEEGFCGFPIFRGTECYGVLAVFSPVVLVPTFSRVLKNLSHLVSVALHDTLLFAKVEHERAKLQELNQMKSEFVASVSHDLRSPLTGVAGFTDLLLAEKFGSLTSRQREFLTRIKSSSQSMLDIIVDLLDLARIEAGLEDTKETVSPVPVLEAVLATVYPQAELTGIQLHVPLLTPFEQVRLSAKPERLKQVLLNVVSNAVKYTLPGGSITLEVALETGDRGAYLHMRVSDTGMGIPAEDLPFIFDKFYRVKREETSTIGGSGLGLAIVKSIVEKLNGSIAVESKLGTGTTFSIMLPAKPMDLLSEPTGTPLNTTPVHDRQESGYPAKTEQLLHLAHEAINGNAPTTQQPVNEMGVFNSGLSDSTKFILPSGTGGQQLELIQAQEKIFQQSAYLAALNEATLGLIQRLDIASMLKSIVTHAGSLVRTSHGFVALVQEPDAIEIQVGIGECSKFIGVRLKRGEGLAGKVWQSGKSLAVEDYVTWPEKSKHFDTGILRMMLAVPLVSGSQVVGVLGMGYGENEPVSGDEKIAILSHFAQLASLALDNARLYRAAQTELVERMRAEEIQKNLTQAKGRFLALVSHELRNPLSSVVGFSELLSQRLKKLEHTLQDETNNPTLVQRVAGLRDFADRIQEQGKQMTRQVNDLLDLGYLESAKFVLKPAPCELNHLITMVIEEQQGLTRRHHLSYDGPDELRISADESRLYQILTHLISIAIRYSLHGGDIQVHLHALEGQKPEVVKADELAPGIFCSISTCGMEIPAEAIPHLFEYAEQFDRPGKEEHASLALGLYLSKEIITQHGGFIQAESREGGGCIFKIWLPPSLLIRIH